MEVYKKAKYSGPRKTEGNGRFVGVRKNVLTFLEAFSYLGGGELSF